MNSSIDSAGIHWWLDTSISSCSHSIRREELECYAHLSQYQRLMDDRPKQNSIFLHIYVIKMSNDACTRLHGLKIELGPNTIFFLLGPNLILLQVNKLI